MSKFRFAVRLIAGSSLLVMPLWIAPLNLMAMEPGVERKLVALKLMVISLVGLGLIALALWSEYSSRQLERWNQDGQT
jgi:hypothetical protein